MPRTLVVDDELVMRTFLEKALQKLSHEVVLAGTAEAAQEAFSPHSFDLVLTDLRMPGASGLDLLARIRLLDADVPVVIMTAYGSISTAVEAVQAGAADFVTKPIELSHLRLVVERVLERHAATAEIRRLRPLADEREELCEMVGCSLPMRKVYSLVDRVAQSDLTVLVSGETGTGKELCARAIHACSPRAEGRFQAISCTAFQSTLLESELFGHEQGAFTGADKRRQGHFEAASRGTLFLDEIAEAPPEVQAKLLRAIQEKEITRVGGTDPIKVDVRIVTATNKDLQAEVKAGRFREDLYYRLSTFPIQMPPLRERLEDIPRLTEHFLPRLDPWRITPAVNLALARYRWPGNVRQLKSVLEKAMVLAGEEELLAIEHFPELIAPETAPTPSEADPASGALFSLSLKEARLQFERIYLERLLQECRGNVSETARRAGLGRASLHEKINKLGLDPHKFRI